MRALAFLLGALVSVALALLILIAGLHHEAATALQDAPSWLSGDWLDTLVSLSGMEVGVDPFADWPPFMVLFLVGLWCIWQLLLFRWCGRAAAWLLLLLPFVLFWPVIFWIGAS
jgi:hypothetical protein